MSFQEFHTINKFLSSDVLVNGSGDVDLKHNDGQGHTLAKSESMATTTIFKSGFVQFCQLEEFLNRIFLNGNLPPLNGQPAPLFQHRGKNLWPRQVLPMLLLAPA